MHQQAEQPGAGLWPGRQAGDHRIRPHAGQAYALVLLQAEQRRLVALVAQHAAQHHKDLRILIENQDEPLGPFPLLHFVSLSAPPPPRHGPFS
ncbi:MAG: hypothetical protein ACYDCQ_05005 [Dehalococcoidia bacterium]